MFKVIAGIAAAIGLGYVYHEHTKPLPQRLEQNDSVLIDPKKLSPAAGSNVDAAIANMFTNAQATAFVEVKGVAPFTGATNVGPDGKMKDPNQWTGLLGPGIPVVFNRVDIVGIRRNGKAIGQGF